MHTVSLAFDRSAARRRTSRRYRAPSKAWVPYCQHIFQQGLSRILGALLDANHNLNNEFGAI